MNRSHPRYPLDQHGRRHKALLAQNLAVREERLRIAALLAIFDEVQSEGASPRRLVGLALPTKGDTHPAPASGSTP